MFDEHLMVVKQYQNVIFGQEGDVVEAEVDAEAKENGRLGKFSDFHLQGS